MNVDERKRNLLAGAALAGAGLLFSTRRARAAAAPVQPADVNATEDLMREHGVIRRVLLLYQESARRLESGDRAVVEPLAAATHLFRRFAEDYHERLEEEQLFPALEKRGLLLPLTQTLRAQHAAGRRLTAQIAAAAVPATLEKRGELQRLVEGLRALVRMYEPHAAREDTVLFPAFHALFTEKEFDAIGDRFEGFEHQLLGGGSFESAVAEVAQIEKSLGIYDLDRFTPKP